MEIPGYGLVNGEWDLRKGVREYLGGVDFKGKRVLELGTASGFICFHMEHQGAEVVAYDLSDEDEWDVVPYARCSDEDYVLARRERVRRLNNAWWLCHRAFDSRSKVVYGNVYSIPAVIGLVDICAVCSILLHVRDPFLALQKALRLTRETVIVTEPAPIFNLPSALRFYKRLLPSGIAGSPLNFLPDSRRCEPRGDWWRLSPETVKRFIGVLGFEDSKVTYHYQTLQNGRFKIRYRIFTVVGHRTTPLKYAAQ
jgi:hypothetical protein